MRTAAWCNNCNSYTWGESDGGCSHGHPRSSLRALYDTTPLAGSIEPTPPTGPGGLPVKTPRSGSGSSHPVESVADYSIWATSEYGTSERSVRMLGTGVRIIFLAIVLGFTAWGLVIAFQAVTRTQNSMRNALAQAETAGQTGTDQRAVDFKTALARFPTLHLSANVEDVDGFAVGTGGEVLIVGGKTPLQELSERLIDARREPGWTSANVTALTDSKAEAFGRFAPNTEPLLKTKLNLSYNAAWATKLGAGQFFFAEPKGTTLWLSLGNGYAVDVSGFSTLGIYPSPDEPSSGSYGRGAATAPTWP